ncbi:efflux RND transporter periplasmic adaptor subunit [Brevibacillus humidisoli]|uniref:HlyD family efflux transporter periplasmic adaptor subunit n=1 Tax=Brevibacillus humidisoli TaxID=2895522 RepID=UPI001E493538|nr:HlyD family efflux transporter periplasmic adaptor subunit [Brevibacillus humidisoli]UFJ39603.1 efflux RND transporter periplasmic adaptor subunit [Brevibacillus humidisoli]
MTKKKWLTIGGVAVVLIGGLVYWQFFMPKEEPVDMTQQMPEFPTVQVELGEVKKSIYATGTIEAKAREEIKPELSGKIEQIFVTEGQQVNAGDPLFLIDSSESILEYQKQEINVTRLQQEIADLRSRKPEVYADAEGIVSEVLVEPGDEVTKETVIAKLSNPDKLKLRGAFGASQIKHFKEGMQVSVFLSGSLVYLPATVVKVDREGRATSEGGVMYEVEVLLDNPGAVHPSEKGMIQYKTPEGITVNSWDSNQFEAMDDIEIRAGTIGKISTVLIDDDEKVNKGQLIAKVDLSDTDLEIKEKELALKESQLILQQKKSDASKAQVVAPISGQITDLEIKEGEKVDTGKTAMIIMDMSAVYMEASVDEVDIPYIQVGQAVDVYVTAYGIEVFPGEVVEIPQEGVSEDNSVRFEVKVLVKDGAKMKHGMTGDCDIIVNQQQNVPRLPYNVVEILEEGKGTVMVKNPETGEPMPKEVEIGVEGAEYVEIKSGLNPGDEVLMMNGGGGMMGGGGGMQIIG